MKRRAVQFLFALGLLLTLAAATGWSRARRSVETVTIGRAWYDGEEFVMAGLSVGVESGAFVVSWVHWRMPRSAVPAFRPEPLSVSHEMGPAFVRRGLELDRDSLWRRLGFNYVDMGLGLPKLVADVVTIPAWFVALCCAALTAACLPLLRDRRRRLRAARGLCPACGYDLRGAAHARCPECGVTTDPAPARV